MILQSMTGFSRVEGSVLSSRWTWEIKSVNGKSLDVRWRLPHGLDFLERELRARVSKKIGRGNLQINLAFETDGTETAPQLNEAAADAVIAIAQKLNSSTKIGPLTLDGLLAVKGVLSNSPELQLDEESTALRNKALLESFDQAVTELALARSTEGKAIKQVLKMQIDEIDRLTKLIESDASRSPDVIKQVLKEKLSKIMEHSSEIDEQRLYQEIAILATKADIQEELDRLIAHIVSANKLIEEETVGRKLDFLTQEFNRECNTVCSKSNSSDVTQLGMEMKVIIDQFREQVQNIQ